MTSTRWVRTDAELLFVVDTSRSMLAAPARGAPTRFVRGRDLALRVRAALDEIPAGVVSLSDRALPHLFPTTDRSAFAAVLLDVLDGDRPRPLRRSDERVTNLDAVADAATAGYFSPSARRRLLVVVTDGESIPFSPRDVADNLRSARVELALVHVWRADDRVWGKDGVAEAYRPDPRSAADLAQLSAAATADVYRDGDDRALADAAARFFGQGARAAAGREERIVSLSWYAALAAFIPLGLLFAATSAPRRSGQRRKGAFSAAADGWSGHRKSKEGAGRIRLR
jgi:hypothetical protein